MKNIYVLFIAVALSGATYGQTKIPADSAASSIGKTVIICSKVYGVKTLGSVTLFDMGAAYPKSMFRIAVSSQDAASFTMSLDKYNGKEVCVTGLLTEYKGKAEIVVTKQEQLVMAGGK